MSEYCTCETSFDGSCQLHDRIDALTAENAALRKAVTNAANALHGYGMEDQGHAWNTACEILDAAMEQSHDK
jgi:hypothetical protein